MFFLLILLSWLLLLIMMMTLLVVAFIVSVFHATATLPPVNVINNTLNNPSSSSFSSSIRVAATFITVDDEYDCRIYHRTTVNNSSGISSFSFICPCHRYRHSVGLVVSTAADGSGDSSSHFYIRHHRSHHSSCSCVVSIRCLVVVVLRLLYSKIELIKLCDFEELIVMSSLKISKGSTVRKYLM